MKTPAQHLRSRLDTISGPVAARFGLPTGERPTVSRLAVGGRGGVYCAHAVRSSNIVGCILGTTRAEAIAEIDRILNAT